MAAIDAQAEALGWAMDEAGKICLGEEYRVAVTWGPVPVQTPAGPQLLAAWQLLVTTRNPALGEGPLHHGPRPVGVPLPVEEAVRHEVREGVRQLRDLARSKISGLNGHAKASSG